MKNKNGVKMDHIVYLDKKSNELEKLSAGNKTMIIRGAMGRKIPYEKVYKEDRLFFANNDGSGKIVADAIVKSVFNSDKMTREESAELVNSYAEKLQLTPAQIKRWSGKRYIVLIEVDNFSEIDPFKFDRSNYSNMDDWLIVEDIKSLMQ